ncbi:FAD-binding protein [Neogemmobacter tilapiae]|uniref:2-hydroxy-acid oxidase n=1 Tax=Neogemmobacter tilapiae TaxID=875041 RepID=A0A918TP53_9RHOB|nr:FAD-binding protein [Gemmobacter tilapiae]GHC56016.1 2-hydroxy-acid oxidase [Gemmobacter tilapiae]
MQPQSEEELAEMVRSADAPLALRGGATRHGPGAGLALETGGLSGISLYEPGALTLVVRAGTPLDQVEAALAAEHQQLAFEPPRLGPLLGRDGVSTIGGVAATNASGPRRVQAGACRDAMIGIRFVDGRGEVIRNGGRVMKNVTGYDLVKLLAGSRGRLGVITELAFKLAPRPERVVTLIVPGDPVAAMTKALGSPYDVTGAGYLPGIGAIVRVEGLSASVTYRAERLAALLPGAEIVEGGQDHWAALRDVLPFAGQVGDVWRVICRPSDATALIERAGAEAHLMDWGGGLIWFLTEPDHDLRTALGSFQGHAIRIRGAKDHLPLSPQVQALNQGLYHQFDPKGLFAQQGA